jgi:hypothetical protein
VPALSRSLNQVPAGGGSHQGSSQTEEPHAPWSFGTDCETDPGRPRSAAFIRCVPAADWNPWRGRAVDVPERPRVNSSQMPVSYRILTDDDANADDIDDILFQRRNIHLRIVCFNICVSHCNHMSADMCHCKCSYHCDI